MLGTSGEYDQLIVTTHQYRARVDVVREGVVIRTLAVHAGGVDIDRNNKIVRRFNASVSDPTGELTPAGIRDLLAPFGTEILPWRGLSVPQEVENVSLNETADDWNSGTGWSVKVNGSGFLTLEDPHA